MSRWLWAIKIKSIIGWMAPKAVWPRIKLLCKRLVWCSWGKTPDRTFLQNVAKPLSCFKLHALCKTWPWRPILRITKSSPRAFLPRDCLFHPETSTFLTLPKAHRGTSLINRKVHVDPCLCGWLRHVSNSGNVFLASLNVRSLGGLRLINFHRPDSTADGMNVGMTWHVALTGS